MSQQYPKMFYFNSFHLGAYTRQNNPFLGITILEKLAGFSTLCFTESQLCLVSVLGALWWITAIYDIRQIYGHCFFLLYVSLFVSMFECGFINYAI